MSADDPVQAAYSGDKYRRLSEIKHRYDPENIFRFNQDIKPVPSHLTVGER
jgi:hypothetical protein